MIVGIVGLIGSGKDTFAQEFVRNGYRQDSFANSLKDAASAIFGWPRHLLTGDTEESRQFRETTDIFWTRKLGPALQKYGVDHFTPRLALQLLGTNVLRDNFHDDIWLNSLEYRVQSNPEQNVVISDVRFKNEIAMIKRNKGILIWVRRGPEPDWFRTASKANSGDWKAQEEMKELGIHQSEWDWAGNNEIDYIIENNSTVEELNNKAKNIIEEISNEVTV